jgi:hypothetical protein
MRKYTSEPNALTQGTNSPHTETSSTTPGSTSRHATVDAPASNSVNLRPNHKPVSKASLAVATDETAPPRKMDRGLSASVSTKKLKQGIWLRALVTADRFRVIRTLDIAACCFAERNFKAALTAAQRAVRGMVKAELLKRYRSDRFQTIYGLTQAGVNWLEEAGLEASSSVRRVSDMTNPEHRLWAQFWTLACEARGLVAMAEQELLQHLNKGNKPEQALIQGLLNVTTMQGNKSRTVQLRPDAVATERSLRDGSCATVWLEVDRSKRGSDREASLSALVSSVGRTLKDGSRLCRVVIFCKTERIQKRALAVVNSLAKANNDEVLIPGRRQFLEVEPGLYAVWTAIESKLSDGRSELADAMVGHINIQMLPIWLPKVRIDSTNTHSLAGWFDENYLPYRRAPGEPTWPKVTSPLLSPLNSSGTYLR